MKIYNLKRMTIPKVAVLVTGLTAAVLVATINPAPAQATPRASNCTGCHASATGATTTVTATPSTATPAPGATYQVAITLTANPNGGNTGYGIVPIAPAVEKTFGGDTGTQLAFTATMVAPTAAGTYSYTVWTNQGPTDGTGQVGSKIYSITVAPVVTTPPPTTTTAVITSLSRTRGEAGSKVTIRGTGFGTPGVVKFGTVAAKASLWSSTTIVVKVPNWAAERGEGARHGDRHANSAWVTVTPQDAAASNGILFRSGHSVAPRHQKHLGGDFD